MSNRKQELHDAWMSFVVAALHLLKKKRAEGSLKVPTLPREKYTVERDGGLKTSHFNEPQFYLVLYGLREELSNMEEYKGVAKLAGQDPRISKHFDQLVGTGSVVVLRSLWEYVSFPLLKQLLKGSEQLDFDPGLFERTLSDMLGYFDSETVTMRYLAPLQNFESDSDSIDLAQGLTIRKLRTEELEDLASISAESGMMPFYEVTTLKYAIELSQETRKQIGGLPTPASPEVAQTVEDLGKVILALRLFKAGNVAYDMVRVSTVLDVPGSLSGTTSYGPHLRFRPGKKYSLVGSECGEFRGFWDSLRDRDFDKPSSLTVAIRRFNFAYNRQGLEDKLVDYMIAVEALFMKKEERSELVHRLSLRVARLLGRDFKERQDIQKEVKEYYKKRSSVVHGGETKLTDDVILQLEERLRAAFKLLMPSLEDLSQDELLSHLDLD